jgi:hypothetical protein
MLSTGWLIFVIIIIIFAVFGKCYEFYNLNKLSKKSTGEQKNKPEYVILNDNMLEYNE